MANNYPGPYEIEFTLTGWTSPVREHVMRFSVVALSSPAPGSLPTTIDIQKMNGSSAKLNVVADQIWSFYRSVFSTGITVTGYTLWKYVTGTLAKDFISAGTVTTPAGTNAAAPVPAHQSTLTFRSANGGIMKVVVLESVQTGDARITLIPNAAGQWYQRAAAYHLSADNVAIARDDSYPVAALRVASGQNEKIWRKLFRQ